MIPPSTLLFHCLDNFDLLFYLHNSSFFHLSFSPNLSFTKCFHNILFCGSRGISLSTGRDAGRGKAAYIWISPDPAKAGPTMGGGGVVVVLIHISTNITIKQNVNI